VKGTQFTCCTSTKVQILTQKLGTPSGERQDSDKTSGARLLSDAFSPATLLFVVV